MVFDFKNRKAKSKNKKNKRKTLPAKLKSTDTIVKLAKPSTCATILDAGFSLRGTAISTGVPCDLSFSYRVRFELIKKCT